MTKGHWWQGDPIKKYLRGIRRGTLVSASVLALMSHGAVTAATVTGPYDSADTRFSTTSDTLGGGSSSASATSSETTGQMSVKVAASSTGRAGGAVPAYGIVNAQVANNRASAYSIINQTFHGITSGTRTVDVVYSDLAVTRTQNSGTNLFGFGSFSYAFAQIYVQVYIYPCAASDPCSWSSYAEQSQSASSGSLTLRRQFSVPQDGRVLVRTFFVGTVEAAGEANANAEISGTVSSIGVN